MGIPFDVSKHPRSGNGRFSAKTHSEQEQPLTATSGRDALRSDLIAAGHEPVWVDAALKQSGVNGQASADQVATAKGLLAGELVVCIKCRSTIGAAEADEDTGYCPECLSAGSDAAFDDSRGEVGEAGPSDVVGRVR